jgi:hypothetical protein
MEERFIFLAVGACSVFSPVHPFDYTIEFSGSVGLSGRPVLSLRYRVG